MSSLNNFRWQKYTIWLLIFTGFVLGVLMIWLPSLLEWHKLLVSILQGIGIALITSVILGATIEKFFRQRLLDDTFEASVGYLLHPELKGELTAIYNQEVLCEKHSQIYSLRQVKDNPELVILHCKIKRDLKNISNKDFEFQQTTSLFEWFHNKYRSQIIDIGCNIKNMEYRKPNISKIPDSNRIEGKLDKVVIPKDEVCTIWYETEEIKHISDIHYEMFLFPTINPEITFLESPKELGHIVTNVSFGTRQQKNTIKIGNDTIRLKGVMLPYQCTEVRWWNYEQAQEWRGNA